MQRLFLLAAVCCLLSLPRPAFAEVVSRVAAVVNDEIITTLQLERELTQAGAAAGEDARRQVLEKMIDNLLLQQRISALGLKVSEEELEAAIVDVQRQNKLTRPQLEEALRQQGLGFAEYRENLRQQILQLKLVSREVQSKVEVSNQEVRDYFREHIDSYRLPPRLRLSRISFPLSAKADAATLKAVRQLAEAVRERLRQGEAFNTVLAASGGEGGDMGLVDKEDLTPAFAQAVRQLAVGEVSPVIETPQGFHLLLVTERKEGEVRPYDSVKDEITRILNEQKSEAGLRQWTQELREKAEIDVRL